MYTNQEVSGQGARRRYICRACRLGHYRAPHTPFWGVGGGERVHPYLQAPVHSPLQRWDTPRPVQLPPRGAGATHHGGCSGPRPAGPEPCGEPVSADQDSAADAVRRARPRGRHRALAHAAWGRACGSASHACASEGHACVSTVHACVWRVHRGGRAAKFCYGLGMEGVVPVLRPASVEGTERCWALASTALSSHELGAQAEQLATTPKPPVFLIAHCHRLKCGGFA